MGWGFRKSIKIAPGVRVNLSKSGVSTSIGGKGFTYSTRGRVTVSIPRTGIRFSKNLSGRNVVSSSSSARSSAHVVVSNQVGVEPMSKREQAAQDFIWQVNSRTRAALVKYFVSHGVWVEDRDLEAALRLDTHRPFLNTLEKDLDITAKATRLASDIGTISLAEKEKAMKSVYEVEERCRESGGDRGELQSYAESLHDLVNAWPASPALGSAFACSLLGCFLIYIGLPIFGAAAIVAAGGYGIFKVLSHERRKSANDDGIVDANSHFDALLSFEVTPRPAVPDGRDFTRLKAYTYASLAVVAAVGSLFMHGADSRSHLDMVQSPTEPNVSSSLASQPPIAETKTEREQHRFAWLIGKYPSEVLNDKRFRGAFNHVPQSEWRKIGERLSVTNGTIQLKDGFLVAEGCMSHQCASDQAAFAINEATGKGGIAYRDSGAGEDGTGTTKTFAWRDAPLSETPLADWARMSGVALPSPTGLAGQTASTNLYRTSFDCSKARSDAERLICADADLASDDVQLAAVYAQAKSAAADQNLFRERTRAQWNYREQNCHDRVCLQRWYADQKIALAQIAQTGRIDDQ
jgi:hypothetical protein